MRLLKKYKKSQRYKSIRSAVEKYIAEHNCCAKISDLLETHKHSTEDILNECLEHEREAIKAYYVLLRNVESESIMLEEFARSQIAAEEMHEAELKKMLLDNF